MSFSLQDRRIYVAGHQGMVGSAILRRLAREQCDLLTAPRRVDLREQATVREWFAVNKPDVVIVAAARVGGIWANDTRPGEFIYDNLAIQNNLIEAARQSGVAKLLFLGSSCIYPRDAIQPMQEDALLTGPLEATNEWYAIAKIAGLKLCQAYRRQYGCDFISAMPTNLYGPGDNFDLETSHVLPALLRKAHEAKLSDSTLTVWGSGAPYREFLHVDDLADACVHLLKHYSDEPPVNVGSDDEVTIRQLAHKLANAVGFEGRVEFDSGKPDGTPRKRLDSSKLRALGWSPQISLDDGIRDAYRWFLEHVGADHEEAHKSRVAS
ncbi:GDP-L-fucose synthase family protein [Altererythrobacter sp. GH1-8]|uniref:GDP-L-fucose synthase family protein n=1 Tax=Altererythrobacter sp. GH1-8 TaxID=3349333 RepID=UPI00374C8BF7